MQPIFEELSHIDCLNLAIDYGFRYDSLPEGIRKEFAASQ